MKSLFGRNPTAKRLVSGDGTGDDNDPPSQDGAGEPRTSCIPLYSPFILLWNNSIEILLTATDTVLPINYYVHITFYIVTVKFLGSVSV